VYRTIARSLVLPFALGCGGSEPELKAGPLDLDTRTAQPEPTVAAAPPPETPEKPWRGVPWAESTPPGVQPLQEAEAKEVADKCKPLETAVFGKRPRRGSTSDAASIGIAEGVLELLADPPPLSGVDVKRCASLLTRDVKDFLARAREQRAGQALRTVLLGLSDRQQAGGKPCPAAPPVPKDLAALSPGPYESKPDDWLDTGWVCTKYNPLGAPQIFQLELVVRDAQYRVVARLHPVAGAPVTEIYVDTPQAKVDVAAPVQRRVTD
jgi:hypothetical protein